MRQDGQGRESGANARRRSHLLLSSALGTLLTALLWRPVTVLPADPPGHDRSFLRLDLCCFACAPWSSMHGRATDRPPLSEANHDWDADTQRVPKTAGAYCASVSPAEAQSPPKAYRTRLTLPQFQGGSPSRLLILLRPRTRGRSLPSSSRGRRRALLRQSARKVSTAAPSP